MPAVKLPTASLNGNLAIKDAAEKGLRALYKVPFNCLYDNGSALDKSKRPILNIRNAPPLFQIVLGVDGSFC
jgi:hypothetical protein